VKFATDRPFKLFVESVGFPEDPGVPIRVKAVSARFGHVEITDPLDPVSLDASNQS
jgi:hypothetical protein